jgi:hypothetical protein
LRLEHEHDIKVNINIKVRVADGMILRQNAPRRMLLLPISEEQLANVSAGKQQHAPFLRSLVPNFEKQTLNASLFERKITIFDIGIK